MAANVQLALVIHNHQPVGNFDSVMNMACDEAYLPFLTMLAEFPTLRLGLHTSGCLFEWLEQHRPEYGELVGELLKRGQIELLGGGMYEPILPVLPERDAHWQIERLQTFLADRFGVRPAGLWCPERVWEPQLPALFSDAGIKYTLLDDHHFRASALPAAVESSYFITDHAGKQVALFPVSEKLRYTLPFQEPEVTFEHLRKLAGRHEHTPLAVFGDDGEKFGIWPETHEWVYKRGWLKRFFTMLADNLDWVDLMLPGEVLERRQPADKVFVPTSSYMEMGEWTRVNPEATDGDPPGFWRNYFHKYSESNQIYRKMLFVSDKLAEARALGVDNSLLEPVATELGRGQCNCAYWHGVFGGLYLNYLRQSLSYHLNRAENVLRKVSPAQFSDPVMELDFEALGWNQIMLQNDSLSAVLDPGHGLCLSRLDARDTQFCWSDVLSRRRESYHRKVLDAQQASTDEHASIHDRVVLKEDGLEDWLAIDPHPRVSFTGYFLESGLDSLKASNPTAAPVLAERILPDYFEVATETLRHSDGVTAMYETGAIKILKSVKQAVDGLRFEVAHQAGALPPEAQLYVLEFNFTAQTDQADDRYLEVDGTRLALNRQQHIAHVKHCQLVDEWQQRRLELSTANASLRYYPVYTVSSSESGFERTYQGSCLELYFPAVLLAKGVTVDLLIKEL